MPKRGRVEANVVRVSEDPLILVFPAFVDEQECATLLSLARQADITPVRDGPQLIAHTAVEQQLIDEIEERLGVITGCVPHAEEAVLNHMRQARGPPPPPGHERWHHPFVAERFSSGIHVDTNGGLARRHASALLYLSTPGAGGQTVFPLAGAPADSERDEALAASRALLRHGIYHTGNSRRACARATELPLASTPSTAAPPADAAHASSAHGGVAVRARAGNLLVFWTRTPGGIDPCSFHSGEAVAHDAAQEKWLLRKFKEVPPRVFDDEGLWIP